MNQAIVKTIGTSRTYLRSLSATDATQIYADWLNDPEVNQYLETRHTVQTVASCQAFIESCNADPRQHLFGIFLQTDDRHIGNAKLGAINSIHKTGQLSLFIGDKNQWGKGLAVEVIRALSAYGFTQLRLERIEAGCYEQNLASLHAFMNCGYSVDGFLRKHMISGNKRVGCFWLSLLKDDPIPD